MGEPLGGRAGAEGAAGGREPPVRSIAEEPGGEEAWANNEVGGKKVFLTVFLMSNSHPQKPLQSECSPHAEYTIRG